MSSEQQYLLVIACSQRKRQDALPLPAVERYDGGTYRLLRKAQRDGYLPANLNVLILSAKYGMITASTPIEFYEQRMNLERALELKPQVIRLLKEQAQHHTYQEIYVDLGADYYPAIGDLKEIFRSSSIIYAQGRIGERLANLKKWLTMIYNANVAVFSGISDNMFN